MLCLLAMQLLRFCGLRSVFFPPPVRIRVDWGDVRRGQGRSSGRDSGSSAIINADSTLGFSPAGTGSERCSFTAARSFRSFRKTQALKCKSFLGQAAAQEPAEPMTGAFLANILLFEWKPSHGMSSVPSHYSWGTNSPPDLEQAGYPGGVWFRLRRKQQVPANLFSFLSRIHPVQVVVYF